MELNVPVDALDTFETDYRYSDRCFTETVGWWFKANVDATWGTICAALQAIDEGALARDVAKDHGKLLSML